MRLIYLFIPLLLLGACKSQDMNRSSQDKKTSISKPGACPETGSCDIVIHKNSALTVVTDMTGASYPEIVSGNAIVVEFTYSEKGPEGTADGNYSETIHFQIPSNTETLSLKNDGLSEVDMLWGKHCFCPGSGYVSVNNGSLKINKGANEMTLDLKFDAKKGSQKISHIVRTVKM